VLHLSSTSGPGGAEMVVSRLASHVDPTRFHPTVGLFHSGFLAELCRQAGVRTRLVPIRGALDVGWFRRAWRVVREERVALIHAHEFTANTYGTAVARLAGVPLIATVHGKSYYPERLKRRVAYRLVSRMSTMVAVSHDLKRFIVQQLGIAPDRIRVIHNGVEPHVPIPLDEVERYRAELGLQRGERVVGTVASLYPVKGHTYLLEAVGAVLEACPRTTFLLIGQGELHRSLEAEARSRGYGERVRFLGFRPDVSALLDLMDVFALPSLSEGLSIAVLEAMAAGKPVVATDVGGNGELVVDGETGFLVPARDADALAGAVIRLLKDAGRAAEFGRRGRRRAREHFSLSAMSNEYARLYEHCLGARARMPEDVARSVQPKP
jgi:glycosyltransferase involved in cell wall biosynthesis